MPDQNTIPTWEETTDVSKDIPSWEETVDVKKKEPLAVGSEVGGQPLQTPEQDSPLEQGGFRTVQELRVPRPKPVTSKELNPEFQNQSIKEENWKALKSSSLRTAGGVVGIPALVSSSIFEFIERPIMKAMGKTDEDIEIERVTSMNRSVGTLPPPELNEQVQQKLNKAASGIESTMKQYEEGIIGSLQNGNYVDAFRQSLKGFTQSLPYLALVGATSGGGTVSTLTAIGTAAASQRKGEIGEQGLMEGDVAKQDLNSWLYGGFEASGELFTAGIFNQMKRALTGAAKEVIEKESKNIAVEFFKNIAGESASEGVVTDLGQQLTDYFMGNRDSIDFKQIGDASIVGGFAVTPIAGTTAISNAIKGSRIATKEDAQKVQDNQSKIVDLKDKLENTENPVIKEAVQDEITKTEKENKDIMDKNVATASQLNPEQLSSISNINQAIDENDAVIADKKAKNEDVAIDEDVNKKLKEKREKVLKEKPTEKPIVEKPVENKITLTDKSPISKDDKAILQLEGDKLFTRQINKDGEKLGQITVEETDNTWNVKDVVVDEEKKGYGKEVYRQMNDMAQEEGNRFRNPH
jgi:hypothetical protein